MAGFDVTYQVRRPGDAGDTGSCSPSENQRAGEQAKVALKMDFVERKEMGLAKAAVREVACRLVGAGEVVEEQADWALGEGWLVTVPVSAAQDS